MDIESRQGSKGDSMAAAASEVSVDWRGRPCDHLKHGGMKAAVFVLGLCGTSPFSYLSSELHHCLQLSGLLCSSLFLGSLFSVDQVYACCRDPGVRDDGDCGGGEQPDHVRVRGDALPAVAGGQRGDQLRRHRLHPLAARRLPLRLLRRMLLDAPRLRRRRARGTCASNPDLLLRLLQSGLAAILQLHLHTPTHPFTRSAAPLCRSPLIGWFIGLSIPL